MHDDQGETTPLNLGKNVRDPTTIDDQVYLVAFRSMHEVSQQDLLKVPLIKIQSTVDLVNSALDALSGVHPAIQPVSLAVKAAINLVITSRENERRITALRLKQAELLCILFDLRLIDHKDVVVEGHAFKGRMARVCDGFVDDIKWFGVVMETYTKEPRYARLLKFPGWKDILENCDQKCRDRQQQMRDALLFHTTTQSDHASSKLGQLHTSITDTQSQLHQVDVKIDSLISLFQAIVPGERKLAEFIKINGREACLNSDDLLAELAGIEDDAKRLISRHIPRLQPEMSTYVDPGVAPDYAQPTTIIPAAGPRSRTPSPGPPQEAPRSVHFAHRPREGSRASYGRPRYPSYTSPPPRPSSPVVYQYDSQSRSRSYATTAYAQEPYYGYRRSSRAYAPVSSYTPVQGTFGPAVDSQTPADSSSIRMPSHWSTGETITGNKTKEPLSRAVLNSIRTPVAILIKANREHFDSKMDAQTYQLQLAIKKSETRLLKAIVGGPHERLLDADIQHLWADMHWRGAIDARVFVLGLYDYFTDVVHGVQDSVRGTAREIFGGDKWCLRYFTVRNGPTLAAVVDNDLSGLIRIREVNDFITSKLDGLSLMQWIAYNSFGWTVETRIYRLRMERLLEKMLVIPCMAENSPHVAQYINRLWRVRALLRSPDNAGCNCPLADDERMLQLVRKCMQVKEKHLTSVLETLRYNIDRAETLKLLGGDLPDRPDSIGRMEAYLFPALYIVLKHHYELMQLTTAWVLDDREYERAVSTVENTMAAVDMRVTDLIDNCRKQMVDPAQMLHQFANGMYYTLFTLRGEIDLAQHTIPHNSTKSDLTEQGIDYDLTDAGFMPWGPASDLERILDEFDTEQALQHKINEQPSPNLNTSIAQYPFRDVKSTNTAKESGPYQADDLTLLMLLRDRQVQSKNSLTTDDKFPPDELQRFLSYLETRVSTESVISIPDISQDLLAEAGVVCSSCNQAITGIRHECLNCVHDLCHKCKSRDGFVPAGLMHDPTHKFLTLPLPLARILEFRFGRLLGATSENPGSWLEDSYFTMGRNDRNGDTSRKEVKMINQQNTSLEKRICHACGSRQRSITKYKCLVCIDHVLCHDCVGKSSSTEEHDVTHPLMTPIVVRGPRIEGQSDSSDTSHDDEEVAPSLESGFGRISALEERMANIELLLGNIKSTLADDRGVNVQNSTVRQAEASS